MAEINNSKRRCLYEILAVSRNADNEQIKAAYKKQAKQWHPDKNIDNAKEATIRFKEINEAYEILSDKHERAWYDAHRDAILRGTDKHEINNKGNDDYDPHIDLMPYFSPFIFTSFEDNDSSSYYNIYHQLFLRIIELEKLSKKKTPVFGNSKLSYHKMKQFYSFWEVFESRRSFQFATKYNLNDASNRKIRKLMHKENRNLINQKRKKWEDTILKLISFIKKRDPRWRNYLIDLDKQKLQEELKMKQYQKEIDEIMREEREKQEAYVIPEEEEEEQEEQVVEEIIELFECVVCNKIFKSNNAFKTHQSSKKHLKALQHLKFQLNIENEILFNNDMKTNDQNNVDSMIAKQIAHQQNVSDNDNDDDDNDNDNKPIDLDYLMALQVEQDDIINAADMFDDENNEEEEEEDDNNNNNNMITDTEIIALLREPGIDIDALIDTYPSLTSEYILDLKNKNSKKNKKNKKKKKKKKRFEEEFETNKEDHNEKDAHNKFMAQFKTFNKKSDFINKQKQKMNKYNNISIDKPQKKKKRRRRRKNKDTQNQTNLSNVSPQQTGPTKPKCNACDQMFGSKNKLYDHLKNYPKHALKSQH